MEFTIIFPIYFLLILLLGLWIWRSPSSCFTFGKIQIPQYPGPWNYQSVSKRDKEHPNHRSGQAGIPQSSFSLILYIYRELTSQLRKSSVSSGLVLTCRRIWHISPNRDRIYSALPLESIWRARPATRSVVFVQISSVITQYILLLPSIICRVSAYWEATRHVGLCYGTCLSQFAWLQIRNGSCRHWISFGYCFPSYRMCTFGVRREIFVLPEWSTRWGRWGFPHCGRCPLPSFSSYSFVYPKK